MSKKLILFLTSLSLAVTPIGAFASEYSGPDASIEALGERANLQAATGEYRTWKQYDSRWANQLLGSSPGTMSESGLSGYSDCHIEVTFQAVPMRMGLTGEIMYIFK